jgi:UDP-N-acetylmuramyl pentapeptide phosphotransferase/UDP-N-acetylglucosamine-1-phosphate transferase
MSVSLAAALSACACGGAAAITRALAAWLPATGIIAAPVPGFQERAVPRGGGLAILLPLLFLAGFVMPNDASARRRMAIPLAAATGIAVISLVDDIRTVAVPVRLAVHVAMATVTVAILGPIEAISAGPLGTLTLGAASWPLTLLWIVGMTNAFNFMDGIDAMAGVTTAVASVATATAAWLVGEPHVGALALIFGSATIGFLTANWPPARIFMGDVGSTFCGFLLATMPLMATADSEPRLAMIVALAASPFLFDTASALTRRLLRGENIFRPHRSHLYQRLVLAGWPHALVSCLYGVAAAAMAAIGIFLTLA